MRLADRGGDDIVWADRILLPVLAKRAGAVQNDIHFLHEGMRVIWESSFSRRNDIEAAAEFFESDGRTDPALSKLEFAAVSSEFCRRDGEAHNRFCVAHISLLRCPDSGAGNELVPQT